MTTLKYSKSSSFYKNTKKDFFTENDELLRSARDRNKLYASQPPRTHCKICQAELPGNADFVSHEVSYVFCPACMHLNGCFDDTLAFIDELYISDSGNSYAKNYLDPAYGRRTSDIYAPKAEFLLNSVPAKHFSLLDVGCGGGYFVYAAIQLGLNAAGVDVSKAMIDFGNYQISQLVGNPPLTHTDEDGLYRETKSTRAHVISAIGVIEHLREPQKFFDAFRESGAKYLFYSVPMFSLSVILENVFENVFPRQLSAGHTHLFTESSIKKMNELIGVNPVAEWRFGTDVMDIHRSIVTSLKRNRSSEMLIKQFEDGFSEKIDEIQSILDKNHFCSEIHCVVEKP